MKKTNAVVFDVGAAIGDVSAKYQAMFPGCRIHAFEPFPEFCRKLEDRFKGCANFKLNRVAVGETDGTASLTSNISPFTNSVLRTDPEAARSWGEGVLDTQSIVQVPMVSLDSYCTQNGIAFVDILKLDIQGGELHALRGARSMLQSGRIGLVFLEIIHARTYLDQPHLEDYLLYFRQAGYVMLDLYSSSWKGIRRLQSDAIFVRDSDQ